MLPYTIIEYQTETGRSPFGDWFDGLRDRQVRHAVVMRLARLKTGNLGDHKPLQDGLYELRIHQGAGHRIYFAKEGQTILLLLCAGEKRTQRADIQKARRFLKDYEGRTP